MITLRNPCRLVAVVVCAVGAISLLRAQQPQFQAGGAAVDSTTAGVVGAAAGDPPAAQPTNASTPMANTTIRTTVEWVMARSIWRQGDVQRMQQIRNG